MIRERSRASTDITSVVRGGIAFASEVGRDTGGRMGIEVDDVTEMLERALAQLAKLPPQKQDEVAA